MWTTNTFINYMESNGVSKEIIEGNLKWLENFMTDCGIHDMFEYSDKPWYRAMNGKDVFIEGEINHYTFDNYKDNSILDKVPDDYHAILYPEKIEIKKVIDGPRLRPHDEPLWHTEARIIIKMAFIPNDFRLVKGL